MLKLESFTVILILNLYSSLTFVQGQVEAPTSPPSIVWKNKRTIYARNSARVYCNATGGVINYKWLKNGQKAVEGVNILEEGRLLEVDVEKAPGYYQCEAKNGLGTALSDVVYVGLYQYPNYDRSLNEKTRKEGDYLSLECSYFDQWQPTPEFYWKKNNERIVYDSRIQADKYGNLHFSYVVEDDQITTEDGYYCVLMSDQISLLGDKNHLIVQESTETPRELLLRYSSPSPTKSILGESLILRCIYSGGKRINVEWVNSKNKKVEGNNIEIIDGSALVFRKLKKSDEDSYTCRATSETLSEQHTIEVKVEEAPWFEKKENHPSDLYETTNSLAKFFCKAKGEPKPEVKWFKNGEPLRIESLPPKIAISSDRTELSISRVCKNCGDDAVYQCNTSNVHGYQYMNGFLKIYEPTEIYERPVDVEFENDKNVTFNCKARTDPETKIFYKWKYNDQDVNSGNIKTNQEELFLDVDELQANNIHFIGKWTCEATNTFSTDKAHAYLRQKSVSAFPNWWILLLVLLILLLLLIILCCVCNTLYKNRGSVYPVDEIEKKNGNDPEKELLEYGFHDYQRDVAGSLSGTLRSQRSMGSTNSLARAT